MNISLIEDEAECYENYIPLLKDRGHTVELYIDADDVVKNLETICKSDIVLLDLMLQLGTIIDYKEAPETGIAIYHRIRTLSKDIPILIVSARIKSDVWDNFNADGRTSYIEKPVNNLKYFFEQIEQWLK
jgi:CheY-like chemotaxis protein